MLHITERYIGEKKITKEELYARKIENPIIDTIYKTVMDRIKKTQLQRNN